MIITVPADYDCYKYANWIQDKLTEYTSVCPQQGSSTLRHHLKLNVLLPPQLLLTVQSFYQPGPQSAIKTVSQCLPGVRCEV